MATLNEVLAYKEKFNKKPEFYKRKNIINAYKNLAQVQLKSANKPLLMLWEPNKAYNRGNYKEYVRLMNTILRGKKVNQFILNLPKPKSPKITPVAVAPVSPNLPNLDISIQSPQYVAKAIMKKNENLVDLYESIKIVGSIQKVFLRNPGNQFAVIARKDGNESNKDVEKYREKSLRLDVFTRLQGENAAIQFYSSGTVLITGQGDKKSLDRLTDNFSNLGSVKIERETGTFYTNYRINFNDQNKVKGFLQLCDSKKYFSTYEPELANPIIVKIQKSGERHGKAVYNHTLLFQIKGGIQFNTNNVTECRKLLNQLLKDAIKKNFLVERGAALIGKNSPVRRNKKQTTCANPPTPATFEGDCAPGYYCRPNAQGFPCCYKIPENLTAGRRTAIEAYKKFGIPMPEKVKKLLHIAVAINIKNENKKNNVVWNSAKGVMIRKRACARYSVEELGKFAKPLGIDIAKEKKKREGQKKKLPEGGWKAWLCAEMAKKLAEKTIVTQRVSGSRVKSSNKPIVIEKNNRTHKLTILPGPPITVRGFVRLDPRRKGEEITQRRCDTLDRDTLEKIARRLGIDGRKFPSKGALCQEIYKRRRNIRENVPANSAPFKIIKTKPDGNCFYEAFLRALTGGKVDPSAKQIASLRKKVQTYYTTKYEKLANNHVVDTTLKGKPLNKKSFLEYVMKNGSWAGQAEIKAVSRTMKTNVIVMTPRFKIDTRFTIKNAQNKLSVYILYNGVDHFDTLIPKGSPPRVSLPTRASSGPRSSLPNVVGGNLFGSSSTSTTASEKAYAAELEAAMRRS